MSISLDVYIICSCVYTYMYTYIHIHAICIDVTVLGATQLDPTPSNIPNKYQLDRFNANTY